MIEDENQFRSVVFFSNFENSFDKFFRFSLFQCFKFLNSRRFVSIFHIESKKSLNQ